MFELVKNNVCLTNIQEANDLTKKNSQKRGPLSINAVFA
jgi:hypothetical protein